MGDVAFWSLFVAFVVGLSMPVTMIIRALVDYRIDRQMHREKAARYESIRRDLKELREHRPDLFID